MNPIAGLPTAGPTLELSGPTTGLHYLSGDLVDPESTVARAA